MEGHSMPTRSRLAGVLVAATMTTLLVASPTYADGMGTTNLDWWPATLSLEQLRSHDSRSNPYGDDFDYAEAFNSVDLEALKADIEEVLGQILTAMTSTTRRRSTASTSRP
jgi:catalase (peroxidase I)